MTDRVWYPHKERAWSLARVVQMRGAKMLLQDEFDGKESEIEVADADGAEVTHPCDPSHMENAADIAAMNNLHQAPLLALLQRRYLEDLIYTWTGSILISINPYMLIPNLYDIPEASQLPDYRRTKEPHVFAVAQAAYHTMREETHPSRKNQSLIVSGESGAGKTEACKRIMQFLASLSERSTLGIRSPSSPVPAGAHEAAAGAGGDGSASPRTQLRIQATVRIETKVLDCNPFLEAFGNAMTVRNNNSSRFGKFLKIEYVDGRIIGARMRHYLLEKARVVSPQKGERNYHIFYLLARGAQGELKEELCLEEPGQYPYLNRGGETRVPGMDDVEEFGEVVAALTAVGIDSYVQRCMWQIVAALVHLGSARFSNCATGHEEPRAAIATQDVVETTGRLLGAPDLHLGLTQRHVKAGREAAVMVPLSPREAEDCRDALAKSIYDKLFTWLISRANVCLEAKERSTAFIGILDIFGFEIFQHNSFEQLCINFANEKLQSLFNHHIFIMEQEQYNAEGVDMASIEFINNQPCVDLIEKKPYGILPMLDDVCVQAIQGMTDEKFKQRLDVTHKDKHEYFVASRKPTKFAVKHFAGEVTYDVRSFIAKNNDLLYQDLINIMKASSNPIMVEMYDPASAAAMAAGNASPAVGGSRPSTGRKRKKGAATIANKFKDQLKDLNDTLMATTPHYVRCIKPNSNKRPKEYDWKRILAQLLYSGVLETVRIRRQGYPFREGYLDFWRRCTLAQGGGYAILCPDVAAKFPAAPPPQFEDNGGRGKPVDTNATAAAIENARLATVALCTRLVDDGKWVQGRTKLFMKDGEMDRLHRRYRAHHSVAIQAWWRMVVSKWSFHRIRRAFIGCQRGWRRVLTRRKAERIKRQVIALQAQARGWLARRRFARIQRARRLGTTIIQRNWRRYSSEKHFRAFRNAVLRLQGALRRWEAACLMVKRKLLVKRANAIARGWLARARVRRIRRIRTRGCTALQAWYRGAVQRRAFRRQRAAAVRVQAWQRCKAQRWRFVGMRLAAVRMQAWGRGRVARLYFVRRRDVVVKVQSNLRMLLRRRQYNRCVRAARRIERAIYSHLRSQVLEQWLQEVQAEAAWGEVDKVAGVIECHDPRFARMKDVPLSSRVNIRTRFDGKAVLHIAAAGELKAVEYLVKQGAVVDCLDVAGTTPLHKAAAIGDSHLPIVSFLVERAVDSRAFTARQDVNGETALDIAMAEQRRSRRRTHVEVIRLLTRFAEDMERGNVLGRRRGDEQVTAASGAAAAQNGGGAAGTAEPAVSRSDEAAKELARLEQRLQMQGGAESWRAREQSMWRRQAEQRDLDPHYQLLMVQEQARRAAQEKAAKAKQAKEQPQAAPPMEPDDEDDEAAREEPVWTVHQSRSTKLLYYHNRLTGASLWEEPTDFDGEYEDWMITIRDKTKEALEKAKSKAAAAAAAAAEAGGGVASGSGADGGDEAASSGGTAADSVLTPAAPLAPTEVPENWEEWETDSGHVYYFCNATGESRWSRPQCLGPAPQDYVTDEDDLRAAHAAAAREAGIEQALAGKRGPSPAEEGTGGQRGEEGERKGPAAAVADGLAAGKGQQQQQQQQQPLPDEHEDDGADFPEVYLGNAIGQNGWMSVVDEDSGYIYYFNDRTQVTQWERPADFD